MLLAHLLNFEILMAPKNLSSLQRLWKQKWYMAGRGRGRYQSELSLEKQIKEMDSIPSCYFIRWDRMKVIKLTLDIYNNFITCCLVKDRTVSCSLC